MEDAGMDQPLPTPARYRSGQGADWPECHGSMMSLAMFMILFVVAAAGNGGLRAITRTCVGVFENVG
jgi:hypothetical protein